VPKAVRPDRVPGPNFSRADALLRMAEDVLRGKRRECSPVELVISVAAETLRVPPDSKENPTAVGCMNDGTCTSIHATRRLACDCGVVDQVEDERGIALSIGRRRRTIPAAMKRALLRRDKTCRFPGCSAHMFLHGHHIKHWLDGGETKLVNLLCLCAHHHRYVHEYGFDVRTDASGTVTFYDTLGRPIVNLPEPERPQNPGFPTIRAANANLGISAATPECNWDGEPIDYHLQVSVLCDLDAALRSGGEPIVPTPLVGDHELDRLRPERTEMFPFDVHRYDDEAA
jgi:hypothetical protein